MGVRSAALPFWRTRRGQARLTSLAVLIIALAGSTLVLIPFSGWSRRR
jgi:multiple sugar transport system permease protein